MVASNRPVCVRNFSLRKTRERERERERESDMNGMKNGKKWRKNTYKSDGSYCNGKSYVENKVG